MTQHRIEKIGGTSMSNYPAVRDNIVLAQPNGEHSYQRILVVSAYAGMTDRLLEHKKTSQAGIYALFAKGTDNDAWRDAMVALKAHIFQINEGLFCDAESLCEANDFIRYRIDEVERCLLDLKRLCQHGHFSLEDHLATVREMLSSVGEAHSAWNTAQLLTRDGINARFIDLTGWQSDHQLTLDQRIVEAFSKVDLTRELPVVTGYAHCKHGLMSTFDRGYSEMTFSRIAVLTNAKEAVIHKEFHLSSADPRVVGAENAVPIGRTNYDVADQLANLGMEAIHPKAAKGLRQNNIPLWVKNTFEPEHSGTQISGDYVSDSPRVEIIAGCKGVYALEIFDQDMSGRIEEYDQTFLSAIQRFKARLVAKDINANTITHYLDASLTTVKRIRALLEESFPEAELNQQKLAIVSAIGSDMQVPGILAKAVAALADKNISVLAMHQSLRQVDMQFVIEEEAYQEAICSLHKCLVEVHDHGRAICLAV